MSPSTTKGGLDALADCVDAFSFEDDERSGAGGAPVDGLDHAVVLELFDDAHLVVDERCEFVSGLVIEPLAKTIMRAPREPGFGMSFSGSCRRRIAFVGASDRWSRPAAIRPGRARRRPVPRKPGSRTDPTAGAAPSAGPEPFAGAQLARCCRDAGAGPERGFPARGPGRPDRQGWQRR